MGELTDSDYRMLLTFRSALRAFLAWSEREAAREGLTASQHQLLLVLRAHDGRASVTDVANALQIKHHSAVGLVRRAADMRLVSRERDPWDGRVVRLQLTTKAQGILERLSRSHLEELGRAAAILHIPQAVLNQLSADFLEQVPIGHT